MQQLSFFPNSKKIDKNLTRSDFSHNGVCCEEARIALEENYFYLLEETSKFNRKLVSFQANKSEMLHNWIKYREGFSASLVKLLIKELEIKPDVDSVMLDPFAGSGTTLLVAKMLGINAVGIELLPYCHLAWKAKSELFNYDLAELRTVRGLIEQTPPHPTKQKFKHLTITETAFLPQTESDLMAYTKWFEMLDVGENTKLLCKLILTVNLEKISYTRKDGQYLRWDSRADKIRNNNSKRIAQGKKPTKGINKGVLPDVKQVLLEALNRIIIDIDKVQRKSPPPGSQKLIKGNTLYRLPTMTANQFNAVITSPPYVNRYDYTRTYALELAYLGVDENIFNLRQEQLSCTVENRSKIDELESYYQSIGQYNRYKQILEIVQNNNAVAEINTALATRNRLKDVNNRGILTMVNQYFTELTFVFAELYRVCKSGAGVVFVNDNVRYAGEVIPVDTLSTNLAEQVGFVPHKIYILPQRKGNSSQQMGKFGREALRKSITIWKKP